MSESVKSNKSQFFKLARLVDCGGEISARWYVVFYVWDENLKGLVRKRDYSINQFQNPKERKEAAQKLIAEINKLLKSGYIIEKKQKQEKKIQTLSDALTFVVDQKSHLSKNTLIAYRSFIRRIQEYNDSPVKDFSLEYAQGLKDWRAASGIGKTSLNNFLTVARLLFNDLQKRQFILKNYFEDIAKPSVEVKRNVAFSTDEAKKLLEYFRANHPELWFLAITMLYTFMRVSELRELRAGWVLWERKQILIPARFAKSRKSRYVGLSKHILNIFTDQSIRNLAATDYVFFLMNNKRLEEKYFTNLHLKILRSLGMDGRGHTLYSWKHTGVVMAYQNGLDIKTIQHQCGHSSVQTTDIYLRSLGLFQDVSQLDILPNFT